MLAFQIEGKQDRFPQPDTDSAAGVGRMRDLGKKQQIFAHWKSHNKIQWEMV